MQHFINAFRLASQCYPNPSQLRKRVSLILKLHFAFPRLTRELEAFFDTNELRRFIFNLPEFKTNIYKQQTHPCLYRNSTHKSRIKYLKEHFQFLEQTHSYQSIKKIYQDKFKPFSIKVGLNDLAINLSYAGHILREGMLSLTVSFNSSTICRLTFWFSIVDGKKSLVIGCLQGKRNALDDYKEFTKSLFGIRPQNMAIIALRIYAARLGIEQILTFPKKSLYSKGISKDSCLDILWTEQGKQVLLTKPFIKINSDNARVKITDIPTHKRSLYKNRYAFLDKLEAEMSSYLNTHTLLKYSEADLAQTSVQQKLLASSPITVTP